MNILHGYVLFEKIFNKILFLKDFLNFYYDRPYYATTPRKPKSIHVLFLKNHIQRKQTPSQAVNQNNLRSYAIRIERREQRIVNMRLFIS